MTDLLGQRRLAEPRRPVNHNSAKMRVLTALVEKGIHHGPARTVPGHQLRRGPGAMNGTGRGAGGWASW